MQAPAGSSEDLVDALLAHNTPERGGIDRTLAGFVVVDEQDGDYVLLDARDGGQIWRQDGDTREVFLHGDQSRAVPVPPARPARRVATPALCARYQWLVWTLGVSRAGRGQRVYTTDELVRTGIARLRELFPSPAVLEDTFDAERGELARDPHLAIYWLLHCSVLADHERRARVLHAVGVAEHPLLRAFLARLASLPLAGDLPVVPGFRPRRALAATLGAFELSPDELPRACLRALEISPATSSLAHGLQVVVGLERGMLDEPTIRATLARIDETTTGIALVAGVLDRRADEIASRHADALAHLLVASEDPWWAKLEALWHVHELAYDGPALVAATRQILVHDRYHRRALQMAMRAAQIANEPIDAIDADLAIADALLGPYAKLVDDPASWRAVVDSVRLPPLRRALAWRVLQRALLTRPPPDLAAWAILDVLATSDPARGELVEDALACFDPQVLARTLELTLASCDDAQAAQLARVLVALQLDHPLAEARQAPPVEEKPVRATRAKRAGKRAPAAKQPAAKKKPAARKKAVTKKAATKKKAATPRKPKAATPAKKKPSRPRAKR